MRFAAITILVTLTMVATANDEPQTGSDSFIAASVSAVAKVKSSKTDETEKAGTAIAQPENATPVNPITPPVANKRYKSGDMTLTSVVPKPVRTPPRKSGKATEVRSEKESTPVVAAKVLPTSNSDAANAPVTKKNLDDEALAEELDSFCQRIDVKLSSVSHAECLSIGLLYDGASSNKATPLLFKDFGAVDDESAARVLLIGGVHGDEYSSVSIVFKWLAMLEEDLGEHFKWRIIPVLNPDGLLRPPRMSQRMNANGVDLNRNFPTPNWEDEAHAYWVKNALKNKRRYPGPAPLSEPETAWLVEQIESFQPHAVVSVHAPHGVVDFDGPRVPPRQLGPLELRLLGTYPGSMGRYIGIHKGIPLLTLELESAFGMPAQDEVYDIWYDMIGWLHEKIALPLKLAEDKARTPPTDLIRIQSKSDEG